MRYMMITAKHHDGFGMFKSESDPYNIVDATPFPSRPGGGVGRGLQEARAEVRLLLFASIGLARTRTPEEPSRVAI